MAEDLIRYDVLAQEALRGVVRKVLAEVAQGGLPGEHHFFIAFDTAAPGVRISTRLKQRYPEEMTIVLQHQFWDLTVGESAFEVALSFGGVTEKLYIPFSAIKGFFDPAVQFGLQFDPAKAPQPAALPEPAPAARPAEAREPADAASTPDAGAAVVSLDAFRKKT